MPVTVNIDNVPIIFPFEPYDVQRTYMTKVIQCLNNVSDQINLLYPFKVNCYNYSYHV